MKDNPKDKKIFRVFKLFFIHWCHFYREIKHRDQSLSTSLKNCKEKKTYIHPIDPNDKDGKIKKQNSGGDYSECEC